MYRTYILYYIILYLLEKHITMYIPVKYKNKDCDKHLESTESIYIRKEGYDKH